MPTLSVRVDDDLHTALSRAADREETNISELARRGLAVTFARPTYGPGSPHSFVRDSWGALTGTGGDPDTMGRIDRFRAQLADGTALAAFAATTGNASQAIPPGYSPLSPAPDSDRPLWALTTEQSITSPQPFTVPGLATTTGATAPHVENTNPASGSLAFAGGIVSPRGYSGLFDVTRELLDSSNPTVDSIVIGEMLESFHRQLEDVVADELATLTPAGTTAAATIAADVRKQIGRTVGTRRRRATAAVVTAADTIADALAALPAANSGSPIGLDETTGNDTADWHVRGVPVRLSADLGAASSGQLIAAVTSPGSLFAWSTGPTVFRFEQIQGPGVIRLALYGYAAAKAVRPAGVRTLTHS